MRIRVAAVLVLIGIFGAATVPVGILNNHQIVRRVVTAVDRSTSPGADPIRPDEIVTVIPKDAKTALVEPAYLTAAQASDIQSNEEVIGVVINGDARAFPLATLNVHEIVDDVIGGQPVAVTW